MYEIRRYEGIAPENCGATEKDDYEMFYNIVRSENWKYFSFSRLRTKEKVEVTTS